MKRKSILLFLSAVFSLGTASWATSPKPYTMHYEVQLKSESFGNMGVRKLWVKGNKMRWEQKSARLPIQVVKNDKGVFLIHPWNKVAAKYPEGSPRGNPRALLPGPTGSPKAFLKQVKAVKHGRETINNKPCDMYSYTDTVTKRKCKLWVGVRSGKPVQLYMKGEQAKQDTITATYTTYEQGANVSDKLFELPKGYEIRPMPDRKLTSKAASKKPNKRKSG